MIYLDSSVALAYLLAEDRTPPDSLWDESLISSRLLEYEIWNRVNALKLDRLHGQTIGSFLARVALIELARPVLERALEPFPVRVRTLDALHLASMEFLRDRRQPISLASYDARLVAAANALGIEAAPL